MLFLMFNHAQRAKFFSKSIVASKWDKSAATPKSGHKKKPQTMFEAFLNMVARPRIELGTHGFSIRCSTY
jgi:hypothetical protein